ncbi:hypothetical protein Ddye_029345 [Dipteronia dyeriana]|uniref:ABC-2 type transporter transmembrane domain-containing protein n=1 Tax=Dipteronia dyeriana TaxID=168575 RepID=A0AAD9TFD2_9ROSI|nr:hypothetical protein Ddye_029345 [Dipteronia dyeriana]
MKFLQHKEVYDIISRYQKLKDQGFPQKRLQLLQDITGAFRPGVLTALMGVMGDGKTTLMDALSRRKTNGIIEGEDALVGIPDIRGISHEQQNRLTIAVELVSNPSIIFMDEPPTTGLDARAAAIVMRVVKNIVQTMRTVGISGVPKIDEIYNPATWMLEVTSPSTEAQLGLDFAHLYKMSSLCQDDEQDFLIVLGAMYIFVQVMGISNSSSVIPFVATERTIVYRERFAGMYSSWAYSSAQVIIEIPYSVLQALLFSTITYSAINFYCCFCIRNIKTELPKEVKDVHPSYFSCIRDTSALLVKITDDKWPSKVVRDIFKSECISLWLLSNCS